MGSEYKVQANVTVAGVLFNVNGDSTEEAVDNLCKLDEKGPAIFQAVASLNQAALAAEVFGKNAEAPSTFKSSGGGNGSAPPARSSSIPQCDHGDMKDLSGKGYKNRWYCSAPRDEPQCKARP